MSEGQSFGAYRVVRKVGQGGMGAVYLGEHSLIGRRAAIKVLQRERSSQREHIDRFFNEARAAAAIEDPGIVQIYDFGITPQGTAYLVMEYLDGESLSARLRRLHLLAPHDAVRITRQIAGSLAAAHNLGIVHRDLKPENLMLVRDKEAVTGERPKILDFGIAKLGDADGERFKTRTGAVMGTPAYMSPEQCNDTGKIDHRTDIYSLGCVLFHLLTGRPPFDHDGVGAMIAAHLKELPPPPSAVAAHVPAVVDPLVARCLAKRPEERFQTMLELQQACDALLGSLPEEAVTMPRPLPAIDAREDATTTLGTSAGQATSSTRPRRLGLWIGVSAAAVFAGVLLAVMTSSPEIPVADGSSPIAPAAAPRPIIDPPAEPEPEPSAAETKAAATKPEELPKLAPPVEAKPADELPKLAPTAEAKPVETKPVDTKPTKPPKKPAPKKPKPGLYDDWD